MDRMCQNSERILVGMLVTSRVRPVIRSRGACIPIHNTQSGHLINKAPWSPTEGLSLSFASSLCYKDSAHQQYRRGAMGNGKLNLIFSQMDGYRPVERWGFSFVLNI